MTGWSVGDSARLVARAYGWLVGVTVPAATVVVSLGAMAVSAVLGGWQDTGGASGSVLGGVVLVDAVVAVVALGGALVSLPFTHALGLLLRGVRSARLQVLATALLAGVLGTVTAWCASDWWSPFSGPWFGAFIGVSAAAAGALARRGQLRAVGRRPGGVVGGQVGRVPGQAGR